MQPSTSPPRALATQHELSRKEIIIKIATVLGLLYAFLLGIRGLGDGFKGLGHDLLNQFFAATENPFIGLVIGLLGTTVVQSSSVTTSMIVALVAAPDDPLPIQNAIPMIMGANIGTTVTNTLVALGHMGRKDEFERAFAAATCHDFFNFLSVATLLPLELFTGVLSRSAKALAEALAGGSGASSFPDPLKAATSLILTPLNQGLHSLFPSKHWAALGLILISMVLIFVCLSQIVRVLRAVAATKMKSFLTASLDQNPIISMSVGAIATVMVQSSSITTSVLVPLAGAGMIGVAQVFPITLGANVGTTITALIASMAAPAATRTAAIEIALVHLLFNLLGILIFYPLPALRELPLAAARKLSKLAVRSRKLAIIYVLGLFYGLPAILVALSRL